MNLRCGFAAPFFANNKKTLDLELTQSVIIQLNGGVIMTIKEVSKKFGISQDTLRYYERVGMIPPVTRTSGGIRDYNESDLGWVSLAVCMRSAGLPIEAMIEYVKLYQQGDSTIPARLQLLLDQKDALTEQIRQIEQTMKRLDYKISVYEKAVKTGILDWNEKECNNNDN